MLCAQLVLLKCNLQEKAAGKTWRIAQHLYGTGRKGARWLTPDPAPLGTPQSWLCSLSPRNKRQRLDAKPVHVTTSRSTQTRGRMQGLLVLRMIAVICSASGGMGLSGSVSQQARQLCSARSAGLGGSARRFKHLCPQRKCKAEEKRAAAPDTQLVCSHVLDVQSPPPQHTVIEQLVE